MRLSHKSGNKRGRSRMQRRPVVEDRPATPEGFFGRKFQDEEVVSSDKRDSDKKEDEGDDGNGLEEEPEEIDYS